MTDGYLEPAFELFRCVSTSDDGRSIRGCKSISMFNRELNEMSFRSHGFGKVEVLYFTVRIVKQPLKPFFARD